MNIRAIRDAYERMKEAIYRDIVMVGDVDYSFEGWNLVANLIAVDGLFCHAQCGSKLGLCFAASLPERLYVA